MEIKLIGNRKSYQLYQVSDLLEIKLQGEFNYLSQSEIGLYYDGLKKLFFRNAEEFYRFAEKIKGTPFERLSSLFTEKNSSPQFFGFLISRNIIELSLFKSILLIANRLEISLTEPQPIDFSSQIYNEFIIDYTGRPEPQMDIYFLDSKFLDTKYSESIKKLLELNLLVELKISHESITDRTYFIPLVKPGVSKIYFVTDSDKSGNKTYELWRELLKQREIKINNWVNQNRFI